jgi:hypothetical protein
MTPENSGDLTEDIISPEERERLNKTLAEKLVDLKLMQQVVDADRKLQRVLRTKRKSEFLSEIYQALNSHASCVDAGDGNDAGTSELNRLKLSFSEEKAWIFSDREKRGKISYHGCVKIGQFDSGTRTLKSPTSLEYIVDTTLELNNKPVLMLRFKPHDYNEPEGQDFNFYIQVSQIERIEVEE